MDERRTFLRRAAVFLLIGLVLYGGVYAAAERLAGRYAQRNRFAAIGSTPPARYDVVILGASHAAALDYQDMNAQLESLTGRTVVNLAVVGGGVVVNRLIFDYFLTRHTSDTLVYVVDSFAFYSREWNEDRLEDTKLFARAPFDPALGRLLLARPFARQIAFDYLSGFSKINNPDRFAPDAFPDEGARFTRTYRPIRQIDQQRLEYLYPKVIDPQLLKQYLDEFAALVDEAKARGMRVVVIKPPIPDRVYKELPDEASFDGALGPLLAARSVEFHDFSHEGNDPKFFYDTDHLNRDGVLNFFSQHLGPILVP